MSDTKDIDKRAVLYVIEGKYPHSKSWCPYPDAFTEAAAARTDMRQRNAMGQNLRVAVYLRSGLLDEKGKPLSLIRCEDCGAEGGTSLPRGWQQCGTSKLPKTRIASYCPKCTPKENDER